MYESFLEHSQVRACTVASRLGYARRNHFAIQYPIAMQPGKVRTQARAILPATARSGRALPALPAYEEFDGLLQAIRGAMGQ